jgi:ABC-type nickel/cobalt efflux system permease component RcnA
MLENLGSVSMLAVLGIGLVFGLRHATEVDHVVAVSTIVSQHRNVFHSALVGALWGLGHTASLLLIGAVVLSLRVAIPESVSGWLELGVAIMIICLGISALRRALRKNAEVHVHQHSHDGLSHTHVHFHEEETRHKPATHSQHSHVVSRLGWKPVLIGMMHGLAGSGALTLLVLTQISSSWIGFLYVATFGFGSIVGMLLMSGIIGLPFALASGTRTRPLQGEIRTLEKCATVPGPIHSATYLHARFLLRLTRCRRPLFVCKALRSLAESECCRGERD